jgi:hypothetical protein
MSGDTNVIEKEDEEIVKYQDLTIEIQRMWNIKTKVIPVIRGTNGNQSESFIQYVSNKPGKHEIKKIHKKNNHTGHCTHTAGSTKYI